MKTVSSWWVMQSTNDIFVFVCSSLCFADLAFHDIIPSDSRFNGKKICVGGEETFCRSDTSFLSLLSFFLVGFNIFAKALDDIIIELFSLGCGEIGCRLSLSLVAVTPFPYLLGLSCMPRKTPYGRIRVPLAWRGLRIPRAYLCAR